MFAPVIVSCLTSSLVTDPNGGGYLDCTLAISKRTLFASQVECQAIVRPLCARGRRARRRAWFCVLYW
jgi:hypothetical protein